MSYTISSMDDYGENIANTVLNRCFLEYDPAYNEIFTMNMSSYQNLLQIYDNIPLAEKARELILQTTCTKPIKITPKNKDFKNSIPDFQRRLEHWSNTALVEFISKLIRYETACAIVPVKNIPWEEDLLFDIPSIMPTDRGRIFVVRNLITGVMQPFWQHDANDDLLSPYTHTEYYSKYAKLAEQKQKTGDLTNQYFLAGYAKKKIPFDPDVYFYQSGPDAIKFVDDTTILYQKYLRQHLVRNTNNAIFPYEITCSFNSQISKLLIPLYNYYRTAEIAIQMDERKLKQKLYTETMLPSVDQIEKLSETSRVRSSEAHQREARRLFNPSTTYENKISRNPAQDAPGMENGPAMLFVELESDRFEKTYDDHVSSSYTTDAIINRPTSTNTNVWNIFDDMRTQSVGVFDTPITIQGTERILGPPNHRFIWEPQYNSTMNVIQNDENLHTVTCEVLRLPASMTYSRQQNRQEINPTERAILEARMIHVANNYSKFISKETLKRTFDTTVTKILGALKQDIAARKQYEKTISIENKRRLQNGNEQQQQHSDVIGEGIMEPEESSDDNEEDEEKTSEPPSLFEVGESQIHDPPKVLSQTSYDTMRQVVNSFHNPSMPGVRYYQSTNGHEYVYDNFNQFLMEAKKTFEFDVFFDIELFVDIEQLIAIYQVNELPTEAKAHVLMNILPRLGGISKTRAYTLKECEEMILAENERKTEMALKMKPMNDVMEKKKLKNAPEEKKIEKKKEEEPINKKRKQDKEEKVPKKKKKE